MTAPVYLGYTPTAPHANLDAPGDVYDSWFSGDLVAAVAAARARKGRVHITQTAIPNPVTITEDCHLVLDTDLACNIDGTFHLNFQGALGVTHTLANNQIAGDRDTIALSDVTGVHVGDYAYLTATNNGVTTYSHYKIKAVDAVGKTISLNRGLDTAATGGVSSFTTYTPIRVRLDLNGHTIAMAGDRPNFALFNLCRDSWVQNAVIECSGNADTANATVNNLVRATFCYNWTAGGIGARGLKGGTEFGHIAGYYSTGVRITGCRAEDSTGFCRGFEAFYSTHVEMDSNTVREIGTGIGACFSFWSRHVRIHHNDMHSIRGFAGPSNGSCGIQDTGSSDVEIDNNHVAEVTGSALIYCNTNGSLKVTDNHLSQDGNPGNSNHILIRSAASFIVSGNTMNGQAAGLRVRHAQFGVISGNQLKLTGQASTGISIAAQGVDEGYCTDLLVTDNVVTLDTDNAAGATGVFLNTGHTRIKVLNNKIRISSSQATGPIIGLQVELDDAESIVDQNDVQYVSGGLGGSMYETYVDNSHTVVRNRRGSVTLAGACPNSYADNINTPHTGTTGARPALYAADVGFTYYDTTLGKPVFWSGAAWKDSAGTTV